MKKLTLLLLLCIYSALSSGQNYVFFLHNKFLEEYGLQDSHPEYGKCEYAAILQRFRSEGLIVISELRPKNADAVKYAQKIAKQVDSLVKKGVKPSHITVVGTSKGGYIAQYVSDVLKNKEVNYVFIGCCDADISNMPAIKYYGNILSIYERSDAPHSCGQMKSRSGAGVTRFKEIELNTGLKHGFLYKPLDGWMKPAIAWAKQNYTVGNK